MSFNILYGSVDWCYRKRQHIIEWERIFEEMMAKDLPDLEEGFLAMGCKSTKDKLKTNTFLDTCLRNQRTFKGKDNIFKDTRVEQDYLQRNVYQIDIILPIGNNSCHRLGNNILKALRGKEKKSPSAFLYTADPHLSRGTKERHFQKKMKS